MRQRCPLRGLQAIVTDDGYGSAVARVDLPWCRGPLRRRATREDAAPPRAPTHTTRPPNKAAGRCNRCLAVEGMQEAWAGAAIAASRPTAERTARATMLVLRTTTDNDTAAPRTSSRVSVRGAGVPRAPELSGRWLMSGLRRAVPS